MKLRWARKRRHPRDSEKGQASIMIGIMVLTFLFFFCFVVNVGMLVNAKINLQNAADLAAYAGAATQARQLNRISYLNYEMRRQYKKFLFRYYVIGNMAQNGFPSTVSQDGGSTPQYWAPDETKKTIDYKVPVVCLIFNTLDNFCHIDELVGISIPNKTNWDAINNATRNQLENLEAIRQDNCGKIGLTNLTVLQLWLWNTDPDADPDTGFNASQLQIRKIVQGLVKGLGLVPREILLRQRIETLKDYVNATPQPALSLDKVRAMSKSADPSAYERSIQAFFSAYYTLGNHTFPSDSIEMDEIQNPDQLELGDLKTNFDTYAIFHKLGPAAKGSKSAPCQSAVVPQTLKNNFPVGVYKDPKILTYYAIRLRAKAKLLFNPWGADGLELKAYAAAQPFGSRIGPGPDLVSWVRPGSPGPTIPVNMNQAGTLSFTALGTIPNLPVRRDESAGAGKGWDTKEVLGTLLSTAFPTPAKGSSGGYEINEASLAAGYQIAMTPSAWETRYYNIPTDLGQQDPRTFTPSIFDGNRTLAFWAPLSSPLHGVDIETEVQSAIEDLFRDVGSDATAFKNSLKSQISEYIGKLRTGQDSETGESFNIVRLTDPFRPKAGQETQTGADGLINLPSWMMPKDPKIVLTSWNAPNDPPLPDAPGRLGYSVKYVSFDSLTSQKIKTDTEGKSSAQNPPGGDEESRIDLHFIQH